MSAAGDVVAIHVRPATPDDVDLIYDYICALADYEKLRHEVRLDRTALTASLFGSRPYAEVVIAEADGAPAGFALFFHNYSTFEGRPGLYLEDLFVDPARRGISVGRALLRHLAQIAVERNCARMEWAVLDWNAPAIRFYQSIGARPMDDWTVQRLDSEALRALAEA